jgi:hypothetical protein
MTHATRNLAGDANHELPHRHYNSLNTIFEYHGVYATSGADREIEGCSHNVEYLYDDDDDLERTKHGEFLATEHWLTCSTYNSANANTERVISSAPSSYSTEDLTVTSQTTIATQTYTAIKAPSIFRNAAKTKEYLRDEESRRKVMQCVWTGVGNVTEFVAKVQASDKLGKRGKDDVIKMNGKKLAKVCVQVAMKELAK